MGNYKFRFSDIVPNSWFYKIKDMTKIKNKSQSQKYTKKTPTSSSSLSSSNSSMFSSSSNPQKTQTQQQLLNQRKSYYISRNLNHETTMSKNPRKLSEPARKSSKKKKKNIINKKNSSVGCNCSLVKTHSISTPENYPNSPFSFSSSSNFSSEQESSVLSPKTFDSMILSASCQNCKNDHGFDTVSRIDLPPIITKQKKLEISTNGTKKTEEKTSPKRRISVSSSNGVKLRTKSPRIVSRKSTNSRKSSVGESFAVVKTSKDPQKDFKESMVEMIVENNIRKSKDLEELLACYLSLNSDQYHDLIIKVFKQIWFDIQLK